MIVVPFLLVIALFILTVYLTKKNKCHHDCSKCNMCTLYKEERK